ncbi:cytochrome-c peroxidase [Chlorogloeopsis fritschii PCC 9212]|nr:cytochrome c peroxidase [Chlorogloeopsis fritschii]
MKHSEANRYRYRSVSESEEFKYETQASQRSESSTVFRRLISVFLKLTKILALAFSAIRMLTKPFQFASGLAKSIRQGTAIVALVIVAILAGHLASAQVTSPLQPLSNITVPQPDNIGDFIRDKTAAIALGKSLFWDMQLGTDGVQACASCHFHAGADNRSKNQIDPGRLRVNADRTPNPDPTFDTGGRPNYQLQVGDYPFHKLSNPGDRTSTVLSDSNDSTGSQGVFRTRFVDVIPGSDRDNVTPLPDEIFNVQGTNVRQVTARNSPSTINSVFNFRNFWDGRAQNIFNGVSQFGLRDPNAYVLKASKPQLLEDVKVSINNSSLASQAVGPPLSSLETAAEDLPIAPFRVDASGNNDRIVVSDVNTGQQIAVLNPEGETVSGRTDLMPAQTEPLPANNQQFQRIGRKLGKKLLALRPLNKQQVARDDSVLGRYSRYPRSGLNPSYDNLIRQAFKPEWWNSNIIIHINPETGERRFMQRQGRRPLNTNEYTLMEYNFSLFFGLAVQEYESTLVADQTPFDQFLSGNNGALTTQQQQGWQIFQTKGICIGCHGGSELTVASVSSATSQGRIRRAPTFAGGRVEDAGFFNIGVRPPLDDLGVGSNDAFGNPLSESRLALNGTFKELLGEEPPVVPNSEQDLVADGAFKTPGLRNVELTAPYFHNGGQLTLEQVIDFYNRGGDFGQNLPPLNLTTEEKQALVAFLKGLTDERVRFQRAPFDHPQLFVPNGHPGNQNSVAIDPNVRTQDSTTQARDQLLEIPAVGRNGGNPLSNFLGT